LVFENFQIVVPAGTTLSDIFNNKAETVAAPNFGTEGAAIALGSQTTGANIGVFGWSFSAVNNGF